MKSQAQADIPLHYDHSASINTPPEHLAGDYERQLQQK
jgi:hypothetical protein